MSKSSYLTASNSQSIKDPQSINKLQSNLSHNKILLIVCFVGFFASFDYTIFIFLADTLSVNFFAESGNSVSNAFKLVSLYAVGFIARPVGGMLLARYGDIKGRKPALHLGLSILFMTSLIAACLPTYAQVGVMASIFLITIRLIQGAAFANQFGLSCVYVTESISKERLAMSLSLICASGVFGSFSCGLLNTFLNYVFTTEQMMAYAWRIPFLVSGMMGVVGYFLTKRLNETKSFLRHQNHRHLNHKIHSTHKIKNLIVGFSRTRSIIITAFLCLLYASIMILFFWLLPKLIENQINIEAQALRIVSIVGIMGIAIGMAFYGWLASQLNVGRALMIGAALLCVQAFIFQYTLSYGSGNYIVSVYALLGFCSGFISLCPSVFTNLFATRNRLSSITIIFNVVILFTGIILPFSLFYLTKVISFAPMLYFIFMALCAVFISYYTMQIPELYHPSSEDVLE